MKKLGSLELGLNLLEIIGELFDYKSVYKNIKISQHLETDYNNTRNIAKMLASFT